jgi:hypothetical protein
VTTGLTEALHDARRLNPPAGWEAFVRGQPLPSMWKWPMVGAAAMALGTAVVAATIHDGSNVRAIATARLTGLRSHRTAVPFAGVADVDCLTSASMPGIMYDAAGGASLYAEAVLALREALRRAYRHRIRAVMFRQVSAEMLPSVLRWPAIAREGGPIAFFRNTFADFDGYLASLTTSRRWSLRRSVREIEADEDLVISFGALRNAS